MANVPGKPGRPPGSDNKPKRFQRMLLEDLVGGIPLPVYMMQTAMSTGSKDTIIETCSKLLPYYYAKIAVVEPDPEEGESVSNRKVEELLEILKIHKKEEL